MCGRLACLMGLTVVLALAFAGVASADMTLGLTAPPSGSGTGGCVGSSVPDLVLQLTQDPSTPYVVPAGGGQITSWSTDTAGDTVGDPLTFAVVRPNSGGTYTVVGADTETISTSSGVATFPLSTPISVTGGETLALYSSTQSCFWGGGTTPSGDTLEVLQDATTPAAGQTLSESGGGASPPGYTLDVAANLVQPDVGVSTSAGPSSATAGYPALLSSTVTNSGPGSEPITFTDNVPAGLTIDAVAAGSGTCATSAQKVTCTMSVAGGQSAPVYVVVTPTAAGSYTNSVSVLSANTDPNPANNAAAATLSVRAPAVTAPPSTAPPSTVTPKCTVPGLKGIRLPLAKQLVHLLGCTPGSVRHMHNGRVHKGNVIRTNPGSDTYAAGSKITFVVSSGPKKKDHKHHHKHHH